MKIACVFWLVGVFCFVACGNDSNANVTASQTNNSVCIEGSQTDIDGIRYICRNDVFVPLQNNLPTCSVGSVMQDPQGNAYTCQNGNWQLMDPFSFSYSSIATSYSSSSIIPNQISSSTVMSSAFESSYCYYLTKNHDCIPVSTIFSKVVNKNGESVYDRKSNTLKDLRDNQVYKTVTIGSQIWMAENLKLDYDYGTAKSFCYNYISDSCETLGHLYTYSAAIDSAGIFSSQTAGCGSGVAKCVSTLIVDTIEIRGICPKGWHVPSLNEWSTLVKVAGGGAADGGVESYAAGSIALKSKNGWIDNGNGSDKFGFNVKPSGFKYSFNDWGTFEPFDYYGERAEFWTTYRQTKWNTETASFNAKDVSQTSNSYFTFSVTMTDDNGVSLRCLKNKD